MSQNISLPPEIDVSNRTPRNAIAFDTTSGNKQKADVTKKLLLVGQKLSAGTLPVATLQQLLRPTDTEGFAGAGSVLDRAAKAAFAAFPTADMYCVAVADAGGAVAASATVTYTTNATADGAYVLTIAGQLVRVAINLADTPTLIATASVAAVNTALPALPVVATSAAGVLTLTARNAGPVGNGITVTGAFDSPIGTAAAISTVKLTGGTGVPSFSAALAACSALRLHDIALLVDDSASGTAARSYVETQGNAENSHGQIAFQAVNNTLSTATTLATALNSYRCVTIGIQGSPTWSVEIVAATAAIISQQTDPAQPYDKVVIPGIIPPPLSSRWAGSDTKTLINGGVTPLIVIPGEKVAICRAVTTYVENSSSDPDYSLLDITKVQSFDYFRDSLDVMFDTNYPNAKWADDDPDGLYPSNVATPSKVRDDIIDVARALQELGILQNVEAQLDEFVVERDGDACRFSAPGNIVQGMHMRFGKIVYFNQ